MSHIASAGDSFQPDFQSKTNLKVSNLPQRNGVITYAEISAMLAKVTNGLTADLVQNSGKKAVAKFVKELFKTVRLREWVKSDEDKALSYKLWTQDETIYVWVRGTTIEIVKGLRHFPIAVLPEAPALLNNISHAQEMIGESVYQSPILPGEEEISFDEDPVAHAEAVEQLDEILQSPDEPSVFGEAVSDTDDTLDAKPNEGSHTARANEDAKLEGIECRYCGAVNAHPYKGTCPQCPKKYKPEPTFNGEPLKPKPANNDVWMAAAVGRGAISQFKSLQGRVLTVIEAAISDKSQREAVKTLINKEFRSTMNKVNFSHEDGRPLPYTEDSDEE
jgi:hypothetical protein